VCSGGRVLATGAPSEALRLKPKGKQNHETILFAAVLIGALHSRAHRRRAKSRRGYWDEIAGSACESIAGYRAVSNCAPSLPGPRPEDIATEDALARLLSLNLERAKAEASP
jgi:hypothetical protein